MSTYTLPRRGSLADALVRPGLLTNVLLVLLGTGLTSLLAQVTVPLPFTPVPITLQTLGVLVVGGALGSRRGALALLLYAVIGLVGLPVFAGGASGTAPVFGATGGYIVGFIPASYVVGYLAERGWDRQTKVILAMLIGDGLVFLFGVGWLSTSVGLGEALVLGLVPFIPGEVLKFLVASGALPLAWKGLKRPS